MDDAGIVRSVASQIVAYYERTDERSRLETGLGLVERERTRRLVSRHLPAPPGVVVDVGCGGGAHALWLAELGYEVHVSDPVAKHIDQARASAALRGVEFASARVGHAAELEHADASVDAVLALGPLYHLQEQVARLAAVAEAVRVLRPGGWFFGAAISKFTSLVNAVRDHDLLTDSSFLEIVLGDLDSGRHHNATGDPAFFTTAYVHDPTELAAELETAGLLDVEIVAVEGLAWAVDDIETVWADREARERLMRLLEMTEREPSVLGASTHLLGIGRRPHVR